MTEVDKGSEPGSIYGYGDVRDYFRLMFGIGVFGFPVVVSSLIIKIAYTDQISNSVSTQLLALGLIGTVIGGYAEIRRRQILNSQK